MRGGPLSRRELLVGSAAAGAGLAAGLVPARGQDPGEPVLARKALIAITLDLEMSRGFPRPEDDHWDFEKGNLDADTKRYAVEAARRVKARGGRIHFFAVGRVFEQEEVGWLEEIVEAGHPVGNHTYDHVNLKATPHASRRSTRSSRRWISSPTWSGRQARGRRWWTWMRSPGLPAAGAEWVEWGKRGRS